jgi:hypothetical protein
MIEMLREQNRTRNAEKSNSLKMAHPNMCMHICVIGKSALTIIHILVALQSMACA